MKKLLLIIFILLLAVNALGTDYYACNSSTDITSNNWCTAGASGLGSCAGTADTNWSTANNSSHTLYANGCTLAIPNGTTVSAGKLSTKDGDAGGDAVAGGGFTVLVNNDVVTIASAIEAGSTDCLTIGSGTNTITATLTGNITGGDSTNADGVYITGTNTTVNIGSSGSPVTITAGTAIMANGVYDQHTTTEVSTVYANLVGNSSTGEAYYMGNGLLTLTGDATGGSESVSNGLYNSGTGTVTMTGNCKGPTSSGVLANYGCYNASTGTINLTGNCEGSTSSPASGCYSPGTGAIVVTGNIINTPRATGAQGAVTWVPGTVGTNFRSVKVWVGETDYKYAVLSPAAADVKSGVHFTSDATGADTTGSYAAGGGGGAWSF